MDNKFQVWEQSESNNIALKANPKVESRVNLSPIIAICSERCQYGRLEQN